MRLIRGATFLSVLLLSAGALPASSATNASAPGGASNTSAKSTKIVGFDTSRSSVRMGGALWDNVTVLPRAARNVTVQSRRAGTARFTNASFGKASASGAFVAQLKPRAAGVWQFRLVVRANSRNSQVVSGVRIVAASGTAARTVLRGFAATAMTIASGATVVDGVTVSPKAHRAIMVQARRFGTAHFVTVSTVRSSSAGAFTVVYRGAAPGQWTYRVLVRASATAQMTTSALRALTVTGPTSPPTPTPTPTLTPTPTPTPTAPVPADVTPPGPVTGLRPAKVMAVSIGLAWTNPTDSDFAGVTIRRAAGPTAPGTPTSGTEVVSSMPASATSYSDTGLTGRTTYSYAVFARDGAANHAVAANMTATTRVAPIAVLSVSASGVTGVTARTSVDGFVAFFDVSGSMAGPDAAIESGSMNYGDGTPPVTFTGNDPTTWDPADHVFVTAGLKAVTLTVIDSAGVPDTDVVTVTVYPAPIATIHAGAAVSDSPVEFDLTTDTPPGTAFTDYDVNYGDSLDVPAVVPGEPTGTLTHTYRKDGTFTVTIEARNDADGRAIATISVIVVKK